MVCNHGLMLELNYGLLCSPTDPKASGIIGFVLRSYRLLIPCNNTVLCLHTLAVSARVVVLIARDA